MILSRVKTVKRSGEIKSVGEHSRNRTYLWLAEGRHAWLERGWCLLQRGELQMKSLFGDLIICSPFNLFSFWYGWDMQLVDHLNMLKIRWVELNSDGILLLFAFQKISLGLWFCYIRSLLNKKLDDTWSLFCFQVCLSTLLEFAQHKIYFFSFFEKKVIVAKYAQYKTYHFTI